MFIVTEIDLPYGNWTGLEEKFLGRKRTQNVSFKVTFKTKPGKAINTVSASVDNPLISLQSLHPSFKKVSSASLL